MKMLEYEKRPRGKVEASVHVGAGSVAKQTTVAAISGTPAR